MPLYGREGEKQELQEEIIKILAALNEIPRDVKVIAIDGRCAAGKTALAKQLAEITGAGLIYMDDFFLPGELRTAERLKEPGGNVHYERFAGEVLPGIRNAVGFDYMRYDCENIGFGARRIVPAGILRIVEGTYSCHPKLGNYMDIRIFCDIAPLDQRVRLKLRNGDNSLPLFLDKWIPREEKYFAVYKIKEQADFVMRQ